MSASTADSSQLLEDKRIVNILNSDSSLDALLTRLKQSITTGDEFSKFIKKRAQIEDDHYTSLKKFAGQTRSHLKSTAKSLKNDSFSRSFDEIISFDDKLYNVGSSYVKALNVMYDELQSLVATITKSRKLIKDEAKRKEKECVDAISAAEKAKQKYFHFCDDLEKLRTTDPNKKSFSLKNKTAEQQEDELQRKVDLADQDYKQKVSSCKKLKDEMLLLHRPANAKKLKNLVLEFDIAMNVQLQKYATWNETLIMNSGVLISPLREDSNKLSMKKISSSIDNEKDLFEYLISFEKTPANKSLIPVEYIVHPSLSKTAKPTKSIFNNKTQQTVASNMNNVHSAQSTPVNGVNNDMQIPIITTTAVSAPVVSPTKYSNITNYSSLDPVEHKGEGLKGPRALPGKIGQSSPKTFGVSIEEVIKYAGIDNVPLVVKRCIEVIEKYGLDLEGIYRASGNVSVVSNLKDSIDQNFANYISIGENIHPNSIIDSEIFCVASLLKTYFSSLPEPLLTQEYYKIFIETVKSSNKAYVAKKLHNLVYNLPDGAYFTLRVLLFHLNKIASHQQYNRMSAKNLSIIWGPVLLSDDSPNPEDMSFKSSVVEELMKIADEIFESE